MARKSKKKENTASPAVAPPGRFKLRWYKLPVTWIAALQDHPRPRLQEVEAPECGCLQMTARTLLEHGGTSVCMFQAESAFGDYMLVNLGKLCDATKIRKVCGEPSQCHENSLRLHEKYPNKYKLMSGFALTDEDGMWRRHSWVMEADGTIVETTPIIRSQYYGVELDLATFKSMVGA
jgi:hypothetical protein